MQLRRIACLLAVLLVLSTTATEAQTAPQVSQEVRKWYDTIESLAAGSKILVDYSFSQDVEMEIGPFAVAVVHHIFRKPGLKTVFLSMVGSQSIGLCEAAILEANPESYGRKYGEDYALLPSISGGETAVASLASDFRRIVKNDYKGTSIEQLPVLKDITGAKSFTLLVSFAAGKDGMTIVTRWLRQWYYVYKTRYLCCTSEQSRSSLLPYYQAGPITSLTTGSQSVEYEQLVGKPGRGTQATKDKAMAETMTKIVFPIVGIALSICAAIIALRCARAIRHRRRRAKLDFYLEKNVH